MPAVGKRFYSDMVRNEKSQPAREIEILRREKDSVRDSTLPQILKFDSRLTSL